ncbi:MAG: saccharopine dehydrogenase NADP-binding domain-containing protein [Actinomycetota bacterium]|nr:saccharopine dehydrogenase NADP-binding domain-containing protein [Actinomycetota bacterium]
MAAPKQTGPIAVYGATGFTGTLVAEELKRREADFVISGRSQGKLDALSMRLGGVPVAAVSLDDAAGLRSLLEPCAAVIACAGPFTLHGEPVLAAAAETGTHYIDTTGEQGFVRMVFDGYGDRAAQNDAALVTGMGFDYAPGDLIASLTAEGMGPLDEIVVAYYVRGFGPTRGTALSALEVFRGGDLVWRQNRWQAAPRSADGGSWRFPEPVGEQRTLRYPAGEQITLPKHVETAKVRTLLSGMALPPPPLASLAIPMMGLAARTPLKRVADAVINRMPEGPSEKDRGKSRFMVSCEAKAGPRVRRGTVAGSDVYGLTAVTTSHAALLAADPSFDRVGALAPAQAFDPGSFLDVLADFGVDAEVEPLPEPAAAAR